MKPEDTKEKDRLYNTEILRDKEGRVIGVRHVKKEDKEDTDHTIVLDRGES